MYGSDSGWFLHTGHERKRRTDRREDRETDRGTGSDKRQEKEKDSEIVNIVYAGGGGYGSGY